MCIAQSPKMPRAPDLDSRRDLAAALKYLKKAYKIERRAHGEDHIRLAPIVGNISEVHKQMGEYGLAVGVLEESLRIFRRAYGENHLRYRCLLPP